MRLENLDLTHQELLSKRFREMGMGIAEYSFANLYLFRKIHAYQVVHARDVYIRGRTRDHFSFLMPTRPIDEWDWREVKQLLGECDCLFPIPETWKAMFDLKEFQAAYSDAESDYLFQIEKIQTYAGRHLDGKRNLVHQFLSQYEPSSFPLTSERVKDAFHLLDIWKEDIHGELCATDYCSCREALELLQPLGLQGKIYYVEDKPAGFILGEPLNSTVFAVHFAKADRGFKGVYPYLFQEFATTLQGGYRILNFEQDLGLAALRKAKNEFCPDSLQKKLRIFLRRLI